MTPTAAAAAARAAPGGEDEEEEGDSVDDDGIIDGIEGSPPASPLSSVDAETRTGRKEDCRYPMLIKTERHRGPDVAREEEEGENDANFAPTAAEAARERRRGGLARAGCFAAAFAEARRSEQQQRGEDTNPASATGHRASADAQRVRRSIVF